MLLALGLCVGCGVSSTDASTSAISTDVTAQTECTTDTVGTDASGTTPPDNRTGYAPVDPSRGSQSPEEALTQTVAGLSDVIRSATFGPTPTGACLPDGTWLHITVASGDQMEADWEAALLAAAVADRTSTDGRRASVIKGWIVEQMPSDASVEPTGQPTNDDVFAGQKFRSPADDNAATRAAADTLAEFNVRPLSIDVLHPLDSALEVIATIDTPEAMNGQLSHLMSVLTGTPIQYEGVYLEIRLPDGSPIATLATAFRNGQGAQSVRPDLADILGAPPHG